MTLLSTRRLDLITNEKYLCRDLNLTLQAGDICGVLGPNGCGKTTLLHTLAGLNKPHHGEIYMNEIPYHHLVGKTLARLVGILFQSPQTTFPQNVWQYCEGARFPWRNNFAENHLADHAIIDAALRKVDLSNFKNRRIDSLSGGEQKRLKIAALLTQTPEVYLLDEPSNHLDLHHQFSILSHFRNLAETHNKTIVMTLHDPRLAELFCNKILLIFPDHHLIGEKRAMLNVDLLAKLYRVSTEMMSMMLSGINI